MDIIEAELLCFAGMFITLAILTYIDIKLTYWRDARNREKYMSENRKDK